MAGFAGAVGIGLVWGRLLQLAARRTARPGWAPTWAAGASALAATLCAAEAGTGGLLAFVASALISLLAWTLFDRALRQHSQR